MRLAVNFDFRSRPLAEQNMVAGLDAHRQRFAVRGSRPLACGDNNAFARLFFGCIRQDNAARRLVFFFNTLD